MNVDSQKQLEMQRLQAEQHLKRQQEHIMQQSIQELQAQLKGQMIPSPQTNMISMFSLPFLDQLRGLPLAPQMPPPTSTASGNKHINSIANVSTYNT